MCGWTVELCTADWDEYYTAVHATCSKTKERFLSLEVPVLHFPKSCRMTAIYLDPVHLDWIAVVIVIMIMD